MPQFKPSDAVVISVIARELRAANANGDAKTAQVLDMAAALLEALDLGDRPPPAPDRGIDLDALKTRLVASGLASDGDVLRAERSLGGYSKDTFLVGIAGASGNRGVVVRRDIPAGTTRTTVVDEHGILQALAAAGFPVAEPLLLERSTAVLGDPFLVTRHMPGATEFPTWQTDPETRREGARDLALFLARLHGFSPPDGSKPGAMQTASRAHVDHWLALWRECRPEAGFDLIDEAYHWLLDHLSDSQDPAALVHGDVGFHNILMQGGRISAVVDWEFAHWGDPAEDLSYCRPSVEALSTWDEFLSAYRAAGGAAIPEARILAYEIWRGVRNATCCAIGVRSFESGRNTDLRLAYAGRILLGKFADDVAEQMRRVV